MKKILLTISLLCVSAYVMPISANVKELLTFQTSYEYGDVYQNHPRTPAKRPTASINGHTLYINGCEGCVLQLVQDGEVVYSTVITSDTVELPETFTGNYDLKIVRGNICFWTEIEL